MTYENLELSVSHFAGDRTNTNIFYFYNNAIRSKQLSSPYSDGSSYPLSAYIEDVVCCQFDGLCYWSLYEKSSGIVLQRWEIVGAMALERDSFSYSSGFGITYSSSAFVVDSYNTTLSTTASSGVSVITVVDASDFVAGDIIILGPSTYGSYVYDYEEAVIDHISGNTIYLTSSLVRGFASGDAVYTNRYFYLFNNYSPYDTTKGALLKYDYRTGTLVSYNSSSMFYDVTAGCFYDGNIVFIKGNEVVVCDPDSLTVSKHFAIDNLDIDRSTILDTYALWIYSDTIYSLRDKYVYYAVDEWKSEIWAPKYNYTTSVYHTLLTSEVYFVDIEADNMIMHAESVGVPAPTANIKVTVLDQARQPLDGQFVSMTSSVGVVAPSTGTTASGGVFYCVYTGTSLETEVEIKATVN